SRCPPATPGRILQGTALYRSTCSWDLRFSAADQRHEFYKTNFGIDSDIELLVERFGLAIADENEKSIAIERRHRALKLLLPIDLPFRLQPIAVQYPLRLRGFHQPAKILGFTRVIILHLLVDARANQFTHRH